MQQGIRPSQRNRLHTWVCPTLQLLLYFIFSSCPWLRLDEDQHFAPHNENWKFRHHVLIMTNFVVLPAIADTRAGKPGQSLPQHHSLVILFTVSGWMFCPDKEQLSRRTAGAHSVSRWINQSMFRLNPSISGNNLGDIIKVLFCHSRGQTVLLFFRLCLCCNSNHGNLESTRMLSVWHRLEMFVCLFVFIPILQQPIQWLSDSRLTESPSKPTTVSISSLTFRNFVKSADLDTERGITHHSPCILHLTSCGNGVF